MTAKWPWALEKRAQCYAKQEKVQTHVFSFALVASASLALFFWLRACQHKKQRGRLAQSITLLRFEVTLPTSGNK
jgi:hypothetical protein